MTETQKESISEMVDNNPSQASLLLRSSIEATLQDYFSVAQDGNINDLYRCVITQVESALLEVVSHYTNGNQSHSARVLGINRITLRKKLKQHKLYVSKSKRSFKK